MDFNTSSWSVKEDFNQAKLRLEIPNFSDVVGNTRKGQGIKSKLFDVGGSKFVLEIYPNGDLKAEEGMLSVFLNNESNHDVVVDYTISVDGINRESREYEKIEKVTENSRIEKGKGKGRRNFMSSSEIETDLKTTVEVKLKREDISRGVVEQNQVNRNDLVQVEERLGGKLDQMKTFVLAELNQQQQQMKDFVRGEIAKVKGTPIPECPVCFLQLKPPKKIVQCLKGHKICEPCSEKEAVVSCPTCKTAFMGRDFGMEAFVRELSGEN